MTARLVSRRFKVIAAAALMSLSTLGGASAAVIDFGPLSGANNAVYTGHSEDGFDVGVLAGNFFEAHVFGNPVPSIYGGPIDDPSPGTIQVTSDTRFSFESVDLASNNGEMTEFLITGLLDGNEVFSFGGALPSMSGPFGFITVASLFTDLIDELQIQLSPIGDVTSYNIDNIVLSPVPLPAALPLFAATLGAAGFARWRRRRKAAIAA